MHAQQDHDAERQLQHNVAGENGFALIDRDLRFLEVNATMAAINGLPVADHLGRTIAEALTAFAPTMEPLLHQVFATGEPVIDIEIPSAREVDGQLRRWLVSCYPVRSRCGTVSAIDMFVHELPAHFKPLSDPLNHAEPRVHEYCEEIDPSTRFAGAEGQHWMLETHHDTPSPKPEEIARPISEDRWRSLLNNIDQGFCILEMLYDDTGQAIDYQFLDVNLTFERHTGLKDAVGKTARELVPGLETHWVETYAQVAETGEPLRFEQGSAAMGRWFEVDAVRVGGADSREVALLFTDTTARMQADNDARLLSEASEQIRVSTDTDALLWAVTQLIGHYMHVSRCCFVEVNDQANQWTVHRDYRASPTLPSIAGAHALSPYPPALVAALQAGRVVAIGDTRSDPKTAASHQTGFQPLGIRAFVSIPLLREGQWVAGFVAFAAEPRDWTTREIALFETIIEWTWNAVEQMRILEALHESQASLALALQAGHAGTFDWDIQRNINRWSPEIEALYDLAPGSFEGDYQAWFKRVEPDDAHTFETGLQSAVQTQQDEYKYELRAILPDQTKRWLEGRVHIDYGPEGNPLRMRGINIDIDERKQSEEAIKRAHERLAVALDRLDGFAYEHDVQTDKVWRSDGFARVLGYEPEAIPAHSAWWVEQIHPDDRAIATGHLLAAQQNDAAGYSVEYRVRHRDSHFLTFWDRGMIERDAQGRAVRVLGTSMNITQRKQADAEREELLTKVQQALQTMELALAKAEEATRERDTLISIAAHDLRTPLTVIFGRAPMLCQRAE